ncbi:hypothetical protein [Pedobacter helvus]|uniref:Uncharacterized protein n=1 Tax=Pedobacter helvus TaxID=2563444 RepID=A0ABW9JNP5_9SPHI
MEAERFKVKQGFLVEIGAVVCGSCRLGLGWSWPKDSGHHETIN